MMKNKPSRLENLKKCIIISTLKEYFGDIIIMAKQAIEEKKKHETENNCSDSNNDGAT